MNGQLITSADTVAELAQDAMTVLPIGVDAAEALVVQRIRHDEDIRVRSLEAHLPQPLRPRGVAVLNDPADFAQYVNRLADEHHSTLWADLDRSSVTAVLDDHADHGNAGWRSHVVNLALKVDPDWQSWMERDGKLMTQDAMAEFLEEVTHTVVQPDAATLLEVATTFRATKKADFSGGVRLQSGDVEFSYRAETQAKAGKSGKLEIPATFTIRLAPWIGVDPVDLTARLRYRIDGEGRLGIGFALLRPDLAKRDAFAAIIAKLREDIVEGVPLLMGTAPVPVQPAQ